MHILLTGGTGFIGKKFLQYAIDHHSDELNRITVLNREKTDRQGIIHYIPVGPYSNPDLSKIDFESVDIVLHLGGYIPKVSSAANDAKRCLGNILFTNSLLEKLSGRQKKIVYTSTIDIYAPSPEPISEKSLLSPQSLYAGSKLYGEEQVQNFCKLLNISYTILRLGHIYGPGEEEYKKIIPLTIQNILSGNPVRLFTSGEELRSFLYIEDCCRMIWNSLWLKEDSLIINVASKKSFSIQLIIETLFRILGKEVSIEKQLNPELKTRNILFDTSRCSQYLGDEQELIEEGLKKEIEYFRNLLSKHP